MKIKIISWNVRGLGSAEKKKALKSLIISEAVDLVLIQESKLKNESVKELVERRFKGFNFHSVEAEGSSGGLVVMWKTTLFSV